MTAEELMKPRFEIIADYPKSTCGIGKIISPILKGSNFFECLELPAIEDIAFPEKYPHLFRKLNWWEYRKIEDMPKKLICKAIPNDSEIMHIEEWDLDILFGWTDKEKRQGCGLRSFNYEYGYFPID